MHALSHIIQDKLFIIPTNQRGYSWTTQHIDDLIADLKFAALQNNSHYIGPLILTEKPDQSTRDFNSTGVNAFVVEDGQQRITTLILMLSATRTRLLEIGTKGALGRAEKTLDYLCFRPSHDDDHLELRLRNEHQSINAWYRHLILDETEPAGDARPIVNLRNAKEHLRKHLKDETEDTVIEFYERLLNSAHFALVDLSKANLDRYLTFDAINSRGLPLSEFDKIKNFSMLLCEKLKIETLQPETEWYQAISQLEEYSVGGRVDEDSYVHEMYNVFHRQNVTIGKTHSSFRKFYDKLRTEDLENTGSLKDTFISFVNYWKAFAQSYGFVAGKRPQTDPLGTPQTHKYLELLQRMDRTRVMRPVLVASHVELKGTASTLETFERISKAAEIYTFRVHFVANQRVDYNQRAILLLANDLRNTAHDRGQLVETTICDWLKPSKASMHQCLDELGDEKAKYPDDDLKGWHRERLYYFLYEYEESISTKGGVVPPWKHKEAQQLNQIEHILPQTHRTDWWEDQWIEEHEADKYKHRLGNLALTVGNASLSNRPFPDKLNDPTKEHFYNHPQATNSEKEIQTFAGKDENGDPVWLQEQIINREKALLIFFTKRWAFPCKCDNETVEITFKNGSPVTFENPQHEYLVATEPAVEYNDDPEDNLPQNDG
jgi:uncharacterized protein with ParB-like and HNH nuclease domain